MKKLTSILFLALFIAACSKSGEDIPNVDNAKPIVKSTISGKIEKGPFIT